ncbi:formylglycine-generating enzyme family protein [candidate division KSB1 bacterium]|nr:formylglycine-generating enzyme family protein [candidate division KSB1 bacterium]
METKMIPLKGGSFTMGTVRTLYPLDAAAVHFRVQLPRISVMDFYLDAHTVSNEQFVRFLTIRRTFRLGRMAVLIHLGEPGCRIFRKGLKFQVEPGFEKFPVTQVTWYGAEAYARWCGKRLPTEAEWEYVASQNWPAHPTLAFEKVTQDQPSPTGFHHLFGNVWEWCADWYNFQDPPRATADNPTGRIVTRQKVLKGGAWDSLPEDLQPTARSFCDPGMSSGQIGFRCARS